MAAAISARTCRVVVGGADVGMQDDEGQTALMFACFAGSVPCLRILHTAGADLNQRNFIRQTVLMKAVCYRDGRIVDWLLRKHADGTLIDKHGKTALDHAKWRNFPEIVKKLDGSDVVEEDEYKEEEEY